MSKTRTDATKGEQKADGCDGDYNSHIFGGAGATAIIVAQASIDSTDATRVQLTSDTMSPALSLGECSECSAALRSHRRFKPVLGLAPGAEDPCSTTVH